MLQVVVVHHAERFLHCFLSALTHWLADDDMINCDLYPEFEIKHAHKTVRNTLIYVQTSISVQ